MRTIVSFIAAGALWGAMAGSAQSHTVWQNGDPVPEWVSKACCGVSDIHHLTPDQVHVTKDGYKIDGYPDPIPFAKKLPSPDGTWWVFYAVSTTSSGETSYSSVYCLFGPYEGL